MVIIMKENMEEKELVNEEGLEGVSGGISWGPFDDAIVNCPRCGRRTLITKGPRSYTCLNGCTFYAHEIGL